MECPPKRMAKTTRPWGDLLAACMLMMMMMALGVPPSRGEEGGVLFGGRRLVCYYANWAVYRPGLAKFTPENINPHLCTHLIYAFAGMNKDYHLKPFDSYNDLQLGNYKKFTNLKTYNPKLKLLIAVGGWNEGSKRFSRLVESASGRSRFVRGAVTFLRKHGFDGLDLDWEYPGSRDGGRDEDKKGYVALVQELRSAFDSENVGAGKNRSRLLLTMAVPAGKQYIDKGYDIAALARHLDFLNLLTYDYHTSQEAQVNHHAPLGEEPELEEWSPDRQLNVEWTVSYYLERGCPASKLVLGVPTYGRSFTLADPEDTALGAAAQGPGEKGDATREAGYLAYYEICRLIQEEEWELEAPHPSLMGPYAYKGDQWVGFDDEDILLEKVKFVVRRGLGGAMVWTLDNDDFRGKCYGEQSPLISTLKAALQRGEAVLAETSTRAPTPPSTSKAGRRRSSSTTPPPFTTPDPGPPFACEDEGFFNHPTDCKKYFWCLDSGPSDLGLVAHAFTCPSGLHFNKGRDSCDYAANVACKIKKTAATTTTTRRPRPRPKPKTTTTTSPSTTTTTAPSPVTAADSGPTVDGQSLAELLNLLQQLGVNQIHDRLHGRESAATTPTYEAPPDRAVTAAPPPSDLFVQYARPARKRPVAGGAREEKNSDAGAPPPVQPRGPQYHVPAPEADEASHDDLPEGGRSTEPASDGFPFVYHTPSRLRPASEDEEEEPTTTRAPARRRVLVRVRPVPGEAAPRDVPPPPTPKHRPGSRYVSAQTVGVRRQVRPVNVLEEEEEEDYDDVTTPRPTSTTTTTAGPRRRPRPRTTGASTTTRPPARRELIVLPSGKPAVPATTRRRHSPGAVRAPPPEVTRGPSLAFLPDGGLTCLRRGVHPHPKDCARFVVCVPPASDPDDELDGFIHDCPEGTAFDERKGRCTTRGTTCGEQ